MSHTIFFSWQSDRATREGRNLIEKALETAVSRIARDLRVEEAVRDGLLVDKDTKGVPGTPPIFQTILGKIDRAAVFVADLTICGSRCDGRPTPNPNVLIEYGWALKSPGHFRILAVMNAAYGGPSAESLPFDLAAFRFPMTYNLAEGASESARNKEREQLADKLEIALKAILGSEEFKTSLPKQPEPAPFPRREPLNGRARFRRPQEPLGFVRDTLAQMTGSPRTIPVYLPEGPAMWLHVSPLYVGGGSWMTQELKRSALTLVTLPWLQITGSIGFLEGADGGGYYSIFNGGETYSSAYVFNTGEVWMIDTSLVRGPGYVQLDEGSFSRTLDACVSFLDRLGSAGPYWWSVGMDGVQNRQLVIPNRLNRTFGHCLANVIEVQGVYKKDDNASELLRPFFEKVFDQCGSRRPVESG